MDALAINFLDEMVGENSHAGLVHARHNPLEIDVQHGFHADHRPARDQCDGRAAGLCQRHGRERSRDITEIVDHHRGPKIDILKYKNKTGYRRRQGHRQDLTAVKVTDIKTGK